MAVVEPEAASEPEAVVPEPVAVEAAPEPEPVAPEKPTRDDLTCIRGIGEGMQSRLNEIGIFSFAQLTTTSVPQIREALGDVGRMARIEEWIDQAQELSESE